MANEEKVYKDAYVSVTHTLPEKRQSRLTLPSPPMVRTTGFRNPMTAGSFLKLLPHPYQTYECGLHG